MLLLDTHVLVWTMWENPSLGVTAKNAIASALAETGAAVSAMSFWELAMLTARQRVALYEDVSSWRQKVLRLGISEIPVSGEIAIAAVTLPEFHGDPGDRFITATALVSGAALITADKRILGWQSPLRRIDARR